MAVRRGKSRWVKVVALLLVGALVLGFTATGLILALTGGKSVQGTYTATDGRTLTLGKGDAAILMVPSVNQSLSATYKVNGDTVVIVDSADPSQSISFTIQGDNLLAPDGGVWKKQKK